MTSMFSTAPVPPNTPANAALSILSPVSVKTRYPSVMPNS